MAEEKKSRYTAAQKRSAEKYLEEKLEEIKFRVPKGQKAVIKAFAEGQGKSVNQFITDCIKKEIDCIKKGMEEELYNKGKNDIFEK